MENIIQKITKPALLVTNIIKNIFSKESLFNLTYSFLKYSDAHYDNVRNIRTKFIPTTRQKTPINSEFIYLGENIVDNNYR